MNSESQTVFADCPECHGSGVKVLMGVFLDRVDETTVPCPLCAERARTTAKERERAEPAGAR